MPENNHVDPRFSHLETSISNVAVQLGDYIKESKEYRERIERDQSLIWEAIKEQGKNLQSAVDRLSARGQISVPVILSTISVIVLVTSAGATVSHMLMESRIRQLEIRDEAIRETEDSRLETLKVRDEMMMRVIEENHSSIQRINERKQ